MEKLEFLKIIKQIKLKKKKKDKNSLWNILKTISKQLKF